ncbi:hypothetical protein FRX31_003552 [Thalictrum thalictroides]|uniref:CCHC-type domain-containing protein n=1 Tax=Thalictrum thalictroides TaxID=46969 RepID=A0A7J6XBJ7_THATH|nr:hypothetical protein FRX31_003552 [Thalictrum thalictroides]
MGSKGASSSNANNLRCFICRSGGHFAKDCVFHNFACVKLRDDHWMRFGVSTQPRSLGREFLSCMYASDCKGFLWVDEIADVKLKKQEISSNLLKENNKIGEAAEDFVTLKISTDQKLEMSAEGSGKAISELVKLLSKTGMN